SWSLVGLAVVIVGSLLIVAVLFGYWSRTQKPIAQEPTISLKESEGLGAELPAGVPMLDPHQADELAALRARQREILSTYAWINRDQGIARIPIRRAMEILAARADHETRTPAKERRQ